MTAARVAAKKSIFGALTLYLDFINMFLLFFVCLATVNSLREIANYVNVRGDSCGRFVLTHMNYKGYVLLKEYL